MGKRSRRDPRGHHRRGKGRATPDRIGEARYPILQHPPRVDALGIVAHGTYGDWAREVDDTVSQHHIVRLTADGVDWGGRPNAGDTIGYCMHPYRGDDCFQAAIATVCQVPIEQVPDLKLDERTAAGEQPEAVSEWAWARIDSWASARGLTLRTHWDVPLRREWWIGVVCWPGDFTDHCLVMNHGQLVFDPMWGIKPPPGTRGAFSEASDITYGITFDKEEGNG